MFKLLNAADVLTALVDILRDGTVIFGMVLTCIGIVLAILAGKIAKLIKKREIEPNDNVKITIKIVGLVLILLSLVVIAIPSVGMIFSK